MAGTIRSELTVIRDAGRLLSVEKPTTFNTLVGTHLFNTAATKGRV
jgi:hypothetical protein